ncbi:hypothetical protein [uncultured Amphritea sp.]|uniref:hypothetical protein n=1 Tax=uncultured Amphritea sp. TaxID=981605 RepID=UPI0026203AEC|nr:hypothetical protein [uncultured Amphritea sp.]
MTYIFRVQDSKGRGPWRPGFSHKWKDMDREIPDPFYDEFPDIDLANETGNLGCGCANANQLKKWFSEEEYELLLKLGYKAVKLKVDRIVRQSENQCVFLRNKPLRKNTVRIALYENKEEQANELYHE